VYSGLAGSLAADPMWLGGLISIFFMALLLGLAGLVTGVLALLQIKKKGGVGKKVGLERAIR